MSVTKNTYTLNTIKQLIDLNGDSTNFDLSFTVTCQDETPFDLLVVDQTTLDNNPDLEYKQANKTISGSIVADKNVYQNYFLILKSATPCVVDVELTKKELPKTPEMNMDVLEQPSQQAPVIEHYTPQTPARKWLGIGLRVFVAIAVLYLVYRVYKYYSDKKSDVKTKDVEETEEGQVQNFKSLYNHSPPNPTPPRNQSPYSQTPSEPREANNESSKRSVEHSFKPTMNYSSTKSSEQSDDGDNFSLLSRLRNCAH